MVVSAILGFMHFAIVGECHFLNGSKIFTLSDDIYTYIYINQTLYLIDNSVGVKKHRLYGLKILQTDIWGKISVKKKKEKTKNTRVT